MGKYLIFSLLSQLFSENERLFKVMPPPLEGSHLHCKVIVSKKWRRIDMLLLHTTNREYHMAYRFVPSPTTLDDLEGHLPIAGLIKCN